MIKFAEECAGFSARGVTARADACAFRNVSTCASEVLKLPPYLSYWLPGPLR